MRELTPEERKDRKKSRIDHVWYSWMNDRQQARTKAKEAWESDLYEWKTALTEMERLPHWLKKARQGALPTVHQQCSHSAPEKIEENKLTCCIGQDVTECEILKSLYTKFAEWGKLEHYSQITLDDADTVAAKVCCWHIFTTTIRKPHSIDPSEGYVLDKGDRMFWDTVYENLSAPCLDDDEEDELTAIELPTGALRNLMKEPE